jgi:hypothetical protein
MMGSHYAADIAWVNRGNGASMVIGGSDSFSLHTR